MKFSKPSILINGIALFMILAVVVGCSKSSSRPGGVGVTVGSLDVNYPGSFTFGDTTYYGKCLQFSYLIGLDSVSYVSVSNMDVQANGTTYNTFVFENFPATATGNFPISANVTSGILQATDSVGTGMNLHYILGNPGPQTYILQSGTLTKTGTNSFTFKCTMLNENTSVTYPVTGSGTY